MDNVVVVGNCQAQALEMMLAMSRSFTERFRIISVPPVHEISETLVPELHRAVASAKVAILQRIDENYRDGLGLGTETLAGMTEGATVVRWPSLYWSGYFPDLFYMRDESGRPAVDGPFDYHDRTILWAFESGLTVSETCEVLKDPERPSNAEMCAAQATAELAVRGKDCDIQVTQFIASEFRSKLLFFTLNHPTNELLGFVTQQVISCLGIPDDIDHRDVHDEILGPTFYPLHVNHVRTLGLEFGTELQAGTAPFKIRGVTYNAHDAIQAFFDYYAANPLLVKLNSLGDLRGAAS